MRIFYCIIPIFLLVRLGLYLFFVLQVHNAYFSIISGYVLIILVSFNNNLLISNSKIIITELVLEDSIFNHPFPCHLAIT